MVKVTGSAGPPYESAELVTGSERVAVMTAARQREQWECGHGCHSLVTDDGMYRQLSPKCAKHRDLIPAKVAS